MSFAKEDYEGVPLLKPYSKKNPNGVKSVADGVLVTIKGIEKVALSQTGDSWVCYFREYAEALPLNKTNIKMLVKLFGETFAAMVGKKVKLIVVQANNPRGGGEVPSIRIKPKAYKFGDEEADAEAIANHEAEADSETEQPDEPDDPDEAEEARAKKVAERRKR